MGAYLIGGVMPLYLRLLHGVPAQDVLAHRILWSVLVVVLLIAGLRGWDKVVAALRQPRADSNKSSLDSQRRPPRRPDASSGLPGSPVPAPGWSADQRPHSTVT